MISDLRRITRNSFAFSIGTILTQATGFLLLPLYTRFLTPEDYGILTVVSIVSVFFSIVTVFGMGNAISRFYYEYKNNPSDLKIYLSTIYISVLAVALTLTITVIVFFEPIFCFLLPSISFYPFIVIILWTAFFNIPITLGLVFLQVQERSFTYSLINFGRFLVTTCGIIIFVVFFREGALGSLKGQCISSVIFGVIGLLIMYKYAGIHFNFLKLKESLIFGLPVLPHELISSLSNLLDRIFLTNYSTLSNIGLYNIGYQFGSVLGFITTSINYAWVPYLFSSLKEYGKAAKPTIARLTSYYIIFIIFFAIGIILFSKEIIMIMTTSQYYNAASVVPLITITYIINGMYYMVVNQLFFLKKTIFISFSTITSVCVNIIACYLLIPRYQIIGAALATIITSLCLFILIFYFSHKYCEISYEYYKIIKVIILATFIIILSYSFFSENTMNHLIFKIILVLCYPLGLIILKIISMNELKDGKAILQTHLNKYRLKGH